MKKQLLTIALAMGILTATQQSRADVTIHLVGGNSDADNYHAAILNVFSNSTVYPGNTLTSYAYETSKLAGSKAAIFKGTISGITGNVIVKTKFAGGELGIQQASHQDNATFLADSVLPASGSTGSVATSQETDLVPPDATSAVTFQSTSKFAAGATVNQLNGTVTYTALTPWDGVNGITGATPFVFVATSDAPFTNITQRLAQDLWSSGKIKLSGFTGNANDSSTYVYATGRDPDSAARLIANLTTGFGANSTIKQYQPSTAANGQLAAANVGTTNNKLIPFPSGTIDNISVATYNNGYSSGGVLPRY